MTNNAVERSADNDNMLMDFLMNEDMYLPTIGEIREGWVVRERGNEILVDIGAKSEGIISHQEIDGMDEETRAMLVEGSKVLVLIVEPEDRNGNLILSYTQALQEQDWIKVQEYIDAEETCECKVLGINRGGVLAQLGQLRGFIPRSQLMRERQGLSHQDLQKEIQGKTLYVKVLEANRENTRLILSELAAAKEIREAERTKLFETLEENDIRPGRVVNLTDFGAFVDIGGVEGLVHLSELSWKRINHPSEILSVGDEIEVAVLNIDQEKQRLALSLKQLEKDPWEMVEELYHVGQLIEATVVKLTKFGAFARINDDNELVGLIHISEMSEEHVNHPREVVKSAETVAVRIIRIDPEQRQLGLSLKQVSSDKFLEADMQYLQEIEA